MSFDRKSQKRPKDKLLCELYAVHGENEYADQIRLCEDNQPLRVVMTSEELKLKFVNGEKTQKCPFVVYADLEALNFAVNVVKGKSTVILERQDLASNGAILMDGRTNSVIAESF